MDDSNANFATKPDSGGKPETSSTQQTKAIPRNAMAAGIAMPISSSHRARRRLVGPECLVAHRGQRCDICRFGHLVRVRSVMPVSMKKAPVASTELIM